VGTEVDWEEDRLLSEGSSKSGPTIIFPTYNDVKSPYVEMLDASVSLTSATRPFGTTTRGQVVIRSRVRIVLWDPMQGVLYKTSRQGKGVQHNSSPSPITLTNFEDCFGRAQPDADNPISQEPGWILCVSLIQCKPLLPRSILDDPKIRTARLDRGLILVKSGNEKDCIFCRLGWFEVPVTDGFFLEAPLQDLRIV